MKAQIINLDIQEVENIAMEYFMESCGYRKTYKNHRVLLDDALQVLANCRDSIRLLTCIVPLDASAFENNAINISDYSFYCTAFEQIPKQNLIQIFAYLLSVGECKTSKSNKAEKYYAEVWANGFLEGGRECIRKHIIESCGLNEPFYVTYSFGPGFYGMNLDKLGDLIKALNGNAIGISIDDKGNISPEKSCGGFFLIVKNKELLPADECKDCIGNNEGCRFCDGQNVIPDSYACMKLLKEHGTPPHVIRHCEAVTDTALSIATAMKQKGYNLDLDLLKAASLLHDICRTEENHGVKGAHVAERRGYRQVAKLIKNHMYYATDPDKERIDEQDILCLADRMVKEDKFVGLEIRMKYILDKFEGDPEARQRIRLRMEENQRIKERIEEIIGIPLEQLIRN